MSYRTRKFFRGLGTFLLAALLIASLVWVTWIVWLDRFVVYSRDGAQILFDQSAEYLRGEVVTPPESLPQIPIVYDDSSGEVAVNTALTQISGFYVDGTTLKADVAAVRAQVEKLPAGTAVMLDVKDIYGYCYYSSDVAPTMSSVDSAAVDELVAYMNSSGLYTIARLPAFRDYYFGLNETENGLFRSDGYALWNDKTTGRLTYWLDPTKEGTMTYLSQIVSELKRMGFDEVVFSEFRFPNTTDLEFKGDQAQAIADAAAALATVCATETFCVSFETAAAGFPLPAGERCRLYFTGVSAVDAQLTADTLGLEDPAPVAVFLTEQGDTRYDVYSVLRPLSSARFG